MKKLHFAVLLLIPYVWSPKCQAAASGRALLISDIHLNVVADHAIVPRLIATPAGRWRPILESSQLPSLGTYGSDTNYRLFSSALEAAAAQGHFDLVLFTGDALPHDFEDLFVSAGGTSEQYPAFALKTESFVLEELQRRFQAPVFAALGNNDSDCGDYRFSAAGPFLAGAADHLRVLAADPEAKNTFRLGGYFVVTHPTVPNEEIAVLNSVLWSNSYASCGADAGDPGSAASAPQLAYEFDQSTELRTTISSFGTVGCATSK